MIKTPDARQFWKSLLKTILIVTTVSSGVSATASDLTTDESAQLNARDSNIETRTFSRRSAATIPIRTARTRDRALPAHGDSETVLALSPSDEISRQDMEFKTARTSFGAGNFATSALGYNASI